MRNLLLFFFLAFTMASCGQLDYVPKYSVYNGPEITTDQLDYFIYQVGDTFSFINSQGRILYYKCASRNHYRDTGYITSSTPCQAHMVDCQQSYDDNLKIYLKCLTDSTHDLYLEFAGGNGLSLFLPHTALLNGPYIPNTLTANLNLSSSSCQLYDSANGSTALCFDSITINSKKYYNVSQIFENKEPDTVYYNQQYGIVKYYISGLNETCLKR